MPWCPKCWEEYPNDFTSCHVCDLPLTQVKPKGAKGEAEPAKPASEKRLPRFLRRRGKAE